MSGAFADGRAPLGVVEAGISDAAGNRPAELPLSVQYLLSLALVGLATLLAFVVEHLISAPNLTLIYVLPVIVAAMSFGWGPALAAVGTGVLAFDFFFTQPYYSLRIASPSDIWAAGLLFVVAGIVSTLAAESRRRAIAAQLAADRALALQEMARVVVGGGSQSEIQQAAATALHQIFRAPAVVLMQREDSLATVGMAGGPKLTDADQEAASGSLSTRLATRAETYPYDQAIFDYWPVEAPGCRYVLGVDFTRAAVERPASPARFVDVVAGYLASAQRRPEAKAQPSRP